MGIEAEIINLPFKGVQEIFYNEGGISIEIKNSFLNGSVEHKNRIEEAKELARLYPAHWSLREGIKVYAEFNSR